MGQSYSQLSFDERAKTTLLREQGWSLRKVAANLGRAPSTLARELRRNIGKQVGYKASWADDLA